MKTYYLVSIFICVTCAHVRCHQHDYGFYGVPCVWATFVWSIFPLFQCVWARRIDVFIFIYSYIIASYVCMYERVMRGLAWKMKCSISMFVACWKFHKSDQLEILIHECAHAHARKRNRTPIFWDFTWGEEFPSTLIHQITRLIDWFSIKCQPISMLSVWCVCMAYSVHTI